MVTDCGGPEAAVLVGGRAETRGSEEVMEEMAAEVG